MSIDAPRRVQSLLPDARGPLSAPVLDALRTGDTASLTVPDVRTRDAVADDDLQLALWVLYELHYRGFDGVDDELEWDPRLIEVRRALEAPVVAQLREQVPEPASRFGVLAELRRLADADGGPSLSSYLQRHADGDQFAEFVAQRSVYQLKEADPHTWAVPKLAGRSKAALVEIQVDEYGNGRPSRMHSELFAVMMAELGLDTDYGCYVDAVPGITLAMSNVQSLFGLHRAWRGALVGQLAVYEMTSSTPCRRYAQGLRRLGASEAACIFYDEHVTADALHEQLALHDLCGSLAEDEPWLAGQIIFGAGVNSYLERRFAEHVLGAWDAGRTSLRLHSLIRGTRFAASA